MQDVDATAESDLARQLGMAVRRFVELFGADWRPVDPYDGQHDRDETWYIAGDPPQLMLAVIAGGVILARPRGRWDGVADLRWEPIDERALPHGAEDEAPTVVADLLRRRRSAFRYCPYCRDLTGPESWTEGACMGCAAKWLGVVF